MSLYPRFRGTSFEVEGGWAWEVWVTLLGSNEDGWIFKTKDVFPTKEAAIEDMKKAIQASCDDLQKNIQGKVTGEYIDMKTNETLKWDKTKQN